jgi:RNA polymerase sigma factor (sigma-70 family)
MLGTFKRQVLPIEAMRGSVRPILGGVGDTEDVQWLAEVYRAHSDEVRNLILRLGGPGIDAEDLVHEVFLAAQRKTRLLRTYDELGGWFHLAAVREVWRVRRRARRRRYLSWGLVPDPADRKMEDPEFRQRETAEWVYAVLEKLPIRQREALVLSYLQGLTSAEIGQMLGCPEETVRARVFHGRKAFVKAVQREQERERSREASSPKDSR